MRKSLSQPLRNCPSSRKGWNYRERRERSWKYGIKDLWEERARYVWGARVGSPLGTAGQIGDPELCSRGTLRSYHGVSGASRSSAPWRFWDRKKMGGDKATEQFAIGLKRDPAHRK